MRLIDADAMRESIRVKVQGAESLALKHELQKWVDDQPTVCDWISVKDKMPMLGETVLFTGKRYDGGWFGTKRGFFDGIFWHADDLGTIYSSTPVTHWRPMPEPPEEE